MRPCPLERDGLAWRDLRTFSSTGVAIPDARSSASFRSVLPSELLCCRAPQRAPATLSHARSSSMRHELRCGASQPHRSNRDRPLVRRRPTSPLARRRYATGGSNSQERREPSPSDASRVAIVAVIARAASTAARRCTWRSTRSSSAWSAPTTTRVYRCSHRSCGFASRGSRARSTRIWARCAPTCTRPVCTGRQSPMPASRRLVDC